jgi:hypothetical protein
MTSGTWYSSREAERISVHDWEYISKLAPDFSPPPLPEGSPGVRCFVLVPEDDSLPQGGLDVIQRHYWSWVNWVKDVSGFPIQTYPKVVELHLPWTAEKLASYYSIPKLSVALFYWMEESTKWKPRTRSSEIPEVWLLGVRGACNIPTAAGCIEVEEIHVGWGLLPDYIISAWTSDAGLEPNRPVATPTNSGARKWYSANEASGAAVHELLHGLGADHHPTGIMGTGWQYWPNIHIKESSTLSLLASSPQVAHEDARAPERVKLPINTRRGVCSSPAFPTV